MRAWTLGSGSSGNSLVIELGGTRLLVDAGLGPRTLVTRLKSVGIAPESIAGLLITHEHVDHAQGAERVQHKWRWPVIASPGTLDAIRGIPARWKREIRPGTMLSFEGIEIDAFAVPHDAAAPTAFRLSCASTGARAGIAHDLGEVPVALTEAFRDLDLLLIEANHDLQMLRTGPYPAALKARIEGRLGHLSNAQAAEWAARCIGPATRAVVLLHLSEQNNLPPLAERAVREAITRRGSAPPGAGPGAVVSAAPRRVAAMVPTSNARVPKAVQTMLEL